MRSELEPVLTAVQQMDAHELPRLLGELAEIQATAMARLAAPATVSRPDELITVEQASERLGMSANYLYRHSENLPFVRRIGRSLRFSSSGLDDYIRARKQRK